MWASVGGVVEPHRVGVGRLGRVRRHVLGDDRDPVGGALLEDLGDPRRLASRGGGVRLIWATTFAAVELVAVVARGGRAGRVSRGDRGDAGASSGCCHRPKPSTIRITTTTSDHDHRRRRSGSCHRDASWARRSRGRPGGAAWARCTGVSAAAPGRRAPGRRARRGYRRAGRRQGRILRRRAQASGGHGHGLTASGRACRRLAPTARRRTASRSRRRRDAPARDGRPRPRPGSPAAGLLASGASSDAITRAHARSLGDCARRSRASVRALARAAGRGDSR